MACQLEEQAKQLIMKIEQDDQPHDGRAQCPKNEPSYALAHAHHLAYCCIGLS
jgi:hypothetical protein